MLRIFTGIVAVATAVHALAQAPTTAPHPQVWDLEWDEPHCTITTTSEDGSALVLAMTPGDPDPLLYVVGAGKPIQARAGEAATIVLQPSGEMIQATAWPAANGAERAVQLRGLDYHFPSEFARSSGVTVRTKKQAASVSFAGSDQAMAALHQCIDKKLAEWGLDPAAYDALQKPPTEIQGFSWIDANDYPEDAINENWSGDVLARLSVDATGKVTRCGIIINGLRSVDDLTCRSALTRGRYDPAIGKDGRPAAADRVVDVVFRVINSH